LAPLARRITGHGFESPGKGRVAGKARTQCDGDNRIFRMTQLTGGSFQPQSPHMGLERFAHHAPEYPVEMERRKMSYLSHIQQGLW